MTNHGLARYLRHAVHGETKHPRRPPRRNQFRRGPARDWKYRAWIRTLPSAVSGQLGCEAAHTGTDGGMSQKASDYSCIPLTVAEHREYHQVGALEFQLKYGIDCRAIARDLSQTWFRFSSEVK